MTGSLYFVQEDLSGPIKIGFTKGMPTCRLNMMQVGNPRRLQLIAEIRNVTADEERRWHEEFAEVRFVGEWFHPTAALLSAIIDRAEMPRCFGGDAPGAIKANNMDRVDRMGWICPRVRKQLADKQARQAA